VAYNTSNITSADTPVETLTAITRVSEAIPLAVLTIFLAFPALVTYRRTRRADTSMWVSGFTGTVIGTLQWGAGLLSWNYAVIPLPIMLFGIALAYWN